jgi:hypothetical protein
LYYQEQTERASVLQTLGILRSAMHMQMADRLLHPALRPMSQLVGDNPMNWLAERPPNYVGEYKNLVYLAHSYDHLHVTGEENKLRFQAKVVSSLSQQDSVPAPAGKPDDKLVEGVVLEPVVSYQWF